ncbi:MAG: 50S ribosomal protein L22 [Planctomycetota bacterium]|nr:MAG: 50S ribosomal protein L22 [Planctomycetota bacterium]
MAVSKKNRPLRNDAPDAPEFRAIHRYARISPRKAGLVMASIRGLPVSEALDQLRHMKQKGAFLADKLLKSAIANADHAIDQGLVRDAQGRVLDDQPDLDVDDLYVHEAVANDGPRLKRWRPRARGSAYPYRRPYAHLTIRLRPLPAEGGN